VACRSMRTAHLVSAVYQGILALTTTRIVAVAMAYIYLGLRCVVVRVPAWGAGAEARTL